MKHDIVLNDDPVRPYRCTRCGQVRATRSGFIGLDCYDTEKLGIDLWQSGAAQSGMFATDVTCAVYLNDPEWAPPPEIVEFIERTKYWMYQVAARDNFNGKFIVEGTQLKWVKN